LHRNPSLVSDRCPEGPEQRFAQQYFVRVFPSLSEHHRTLF